MEDYSEIISSWNIWGQMASYVLFGLAVLLLLGYLIKLSSTSDPKTKFDFINKVEINILWYVSLIIIISAALYANTFLVKFSWLWIIVRIFITVMVGIMAGVVLQNLLKFYYPFYIEKRLKKLRYMPRVSPKSGKPMKLLSEDEEDVYLDEGMQAEENVFSVDYDVWVDEETGYTKIEKYSGHLHAIQCPECNYQTFKVLKEEIIKSPSLSEEGELIKFFDCGYCGHKSKKSFKIAMLKENMGD
ncbi:MAG: hypothetical protein OEX22_11270 [Cyclobacteriaceae bacterium]|nr:hypothetical protein [Cyclobacteriaceae bacterium]